MLAIIDSRAVDAPVTGDEAYRELALRLEDNYDYNLPTIRRLIIEVGAWLPYSGGCDAKNRQRSVERNLKPQAHAAVAEYHET